MTAQHTPGPWRISGPPPLTGDPHEISIKAANIPVARISRSAKIAFGERAANARLIAAAPELLEALRRIEGLTRAPDTLAAHPITCMQTIEALARAAIDKAEGRS